MTRYLRQLSTRKINKVKYKFKWKTKFLIKKNQQKFPYSPHSSISRRNHLVGLQCHSTYWFQYRAKEKQKARKSMRFSSPKDLISFQCFLFTKSIPQTDKFSLNISSYKSDIIHVHITKPTRRVIYPAFSNVLFKSFYIQTSFKLSSTKTHIFGSKNEILSDTWNTVLGRSAVKFESQTIKKVIFSWKIPFSNWVRTFTYFEHLSFKRLKILTVYWDRAAFFQ